MTMGGKGPEVLVTLTTDFGKILSGLHDTKIKGGTHLATGIQVAGVRISSLHPLYHWILGGVYCADQSASGPCS
jgi:Mg-chelatase subunit ChlD